jgi:hypothetical protein
MRPLPKPPGSHQWSMPASAIMSYARTQSRRFNDPRGIVRTVIMQ